MGVGLAPYGALALAAWRGRRAETLSLIESSTAEATARGEGMGLTVAHWAGAVLHNGLGEYEAALAQAQLAVAHRDDPGGAPAWALAELAEAAVRVGRPHLAEDALHRLVATTSPAATDWSLGLEARTRSLLETDAAADDLYCESIERLERTTVRVELARTHLLYGEWLRRQRRRLDARAHLRVAHDLFTEMGIEGFADRAGRELLATGATARARTVESSNQLTAQEAQVAQMARDHLSNPEIGARLFISPRTVEYHLRKVFMKLDISARSQLDEALRGLGQAGQKRPV
jgi:DNA-binding CsgD family transcriptional regulator